MKERFFMGENVVFQKEKVAIHAISQFSINQYLVNFPEFTHFTLHFDDFKTYQTEIDLYLKHDASVVFDGFRLNIQKHQIELYASETRGFLYALTKLDSLWENQSFPIGLWVETPSVKERGIIEGFYGVPWTPQNRIDTMRFMMDMKMNTYIYAPKDDPYHREQWREPYPNTLMNQLTNLVDTANQSWIDFVYCISPGKDIDLCNPSDIKRVATKLLEINQSSVSKFALLMDDIDYNLTGEALTKFKTPGIAHSYLANKVYEYLQEHLVSFDFYVCPTEYWQNWDTPYRKDMKNHLHPEINVFFTGYHTIAKSIPLQDIETVYSSFQHPLAIWDNYPTNDVNRDRLFLGPLVNRTSQLPKDKVKSYVANPMNQWHMSLIPLYTIAKYLWNTLNYDEETILEEAICYFAKQWNINEVSLQTFVMLNQSTRLRQSSPNEFIYDITNQNQAKIELWYDMFHKCLDDLKNLDYSILVEINPWLDTFTTELHYFELYLNGQVVDILPHQVNLGFNFGSYVQSILGGSNE